MNGIRFEQVRKIYPNSPAPAVDQVSLDALPGLFLVLLGPSGCGKTTLLKMVNRLQEPDSGRVLLDGKDVRSLEVTALRRRIGYVIQQVGLFPHMTVAQNIAVVPELMGWTRPRIQARVDELLEMVNLPLDFRNRYPAQLSGGQQQRVGLARALAADPEVLLMDEPFGAIDAITRTSLQDQLLELQRRLHKTVLFVTHDVEEALRLADQIAVLRQGKLVQVDTPCGLLNQPADDFVRQLLNSDDRVRQIGLMRVETVMTPLPAEGVQAGQPEIALGQDLRQALSLMLRPGIQAVTVMEQGRPVGQVTFEALRAVGCELRK
jgi:osmoprotectant transport system ATP-binding protein